MVTPLSSSELVALHKAQPVLDQFGPDSDFPFLAFELNQQVEATLGSWLTSLPCPVIGVKMHKMINNNALQDYCDVVLEDPKDLIAISKNILHAPKAAMVLVQLLRLQQGLPLNAALTAESFAYASLQNGPEFTKWKKNAKPENLPLIDAPDLKITADIDRLSITLNRPDTRNAIGIKMRDELCEVLDMAKIANYDRIEISAAGRTFSTGGAVEEFGQVSDPTTAHWIRSLRLPATRLSALKDKLHIHVNGAAIGAGAEIAAFGNHISASPKAWFQLPELRYGLIPGAGGTVSLGARIGRHKTAYMALSMAKITARTALEWGLIDEITQRS